MLPLLLCIVMTTCLHMLQQWRRSLPDGLQGWPIFHFTIKHRAAREREQGWRCFVEEATGCTATGGCFWMRVFWGAATWWGWPPQPHLHWCPTPKDQLKEAQKSDPYICPVLDFRLLVSKPYGKEVQAFIPKTDFLLKQQTNGQWCILYRKTWTNREFAWSSTNIVLIQYINLWTGACWFCTFWSMQRWMWVYPCCLATLYTFALWRHIHQVLSLMTFP